MHHSSGRWQRNRRNRLEHLSVSHRLALPTPFSFGHPNGRSMVGSRQLPRPHAPQASPLCYPLPLTNALSVTFSPHEHPQPHRRCPSREHPRPHHRPTRRRKHRCDFRARAKRHHRAIPQQRPPQRPRNRPRRVHRRVRHLPHPCTAPGRDRAPRFLHRARPAGGHRERGAGPDRRAPRRPRERRTHRSG